MARAQTFEDLEGFVREGHFGAGQVPRVEVFRVPSRVSMGEDVIVSWRAENTRRVELLLSGAEQAHRAVAPVGRWSFQAQRPGYVLVELRCWGAAEPEGSEPSCMRTARLQVNAPELRLQLARPTLRATPGASVQLHWISEGATSVELTRPLTGERLHLPPRGMATLVMDWVEELIQIQANGHEPSASTTVSCQLSPVLTGLADIDAELKTLIDPLLELNSWT